MVKIDYLLTVEVVFGLDLMQTHLEMVFMLQAIIIYIFQIHRMMLEKLLVLHLDYQLVMTSEQQLLMKESHLTVLVI